MKKEKWLHIFNEKKHEEMLISLNFEKAIKYDFYHVILNGEVGSEEKYLFNNYNDGTIYAYKLGPNGITGEVEIDPRTLKSKSYQVTHYYKAHEFYYSGLDELKRKDKINRVKANLRNLHSGSTQFLYNQQKLIIRDRMYILSEILDIYFESKCSEPVNYYFVINRLYTNRWIFHPDNNSLSVKVRFYLDSLVASGDLNSSEYGRYTPVPQALATLEEFRKGAQKEKKESSARSWGLFWAGIAAAFTLFSAWGTLVQAGIMPKIPLWGG